MTYVIITGAHFFPYAWFYDEIGYAIFAGIISIGALVVAIKVNVEKMYYVPLFMVLCLLLDKPGKLTHLRRMKLTMANGLPRFDLSLG